MWNKTLFDCPLWSLWTRVTLNSNHVFNQWLLTIWQPHSHNHNVKYTMKPSGVELIQLCKHSHAPDQQQHIHTYWNRQQQRCDWWKIKPIDLNELQHDGAEPRRYSAGCNFLIETMWRCKWEAASFEEHRQWGPRQCLDVSRNGMSVTPEEDCMQSRVNQSIPLDCCLENFVRGLKRLQTMMMFSGRDGTNLRCCSAVRVHASTRCVSFCRIVCEMDPAPVESRPGPVQLCVGDCFPELRARSAQLYSFVVRTLLFTISPLACCRLAQECSRFNSTCLGISEFDKRMCVAMATVSLMKLFLVPCDFKGNVLNEDGNALGALA